MTRWQDCMYFKPPTFHKVHLKFSCTDIRARRIDRPLAVMETARIFLPLAFRKTVNSLNRKGRLLVALNLLVALDDGLSRLAGVDGGRASGCGGGWKGGISSLSSSLHCCVRQCAADQNTFPWQVKTIGRCTSAPEDRTGGGRDQPSLPRPVHRGK